MASPARTLLDPYRPLPTTRDGMPIFYEDEEEGDMGESAPHSDAAEILHICVKAHLAGRPAYQVFVNMNCYYLDGPEHPKTGSLPYVSPDIMVVKPKRDLGERPTSFTIGEDGPAPVLVAEALSPRSAQQRDLRDKLVIYAKLGITEYLLVDTSGKYLPERLLLKRLGRSGAWTNRQDADGGISSRLKFRVLIDSDGRLRLADATTGKRYPRPDEADSLGETARREAEARQQAEAARQQAEAARQQAEAARQQAEAARQQAETRIRELEAENARLRESAKKKGGRGKN